MMQPPSAPARRSVRYSEEAPRQGECMRRLTLLVILVVATFAIAAPAIMCRRIERVRLAGSPFCAAGKIMHLP